MKGGQEGYRGIYGEGSAVVDSGVRMRDWPDASPFEQAEHNVDRSVVRVEESVP